MRHINSGMSHMANTDKLICLALSMLFLAPNLAVMWMDEADYRAAEMDEPLASVTATFPSIDFLPLLEAVEARQAEHYREDVPLSRELQEVLWEACQESGVPFLLALGLIETESNFDPEADNGVCYGLTQLNKRYWPDFLTPDDNIRCGIGYLGELLSYYGDTAVALTIYNAGFDSGDRTYADAVLASAEKWRNF